MSSSSAPGSEWVMLEPEYEKAQRRRRIQNLDFALKISIGFIVLLLFKVLYWDHTDAECGDPRVLKLDQRIKGLQRLWSSPPELQAKYDRLAGEFDKHQHQVNEMALIYSNITEVKTILGDVQVEIDEVHMLKEMGISANKQVKLTLGEMHTFTDHLASKLHEGLGKVSSDAVAMAKKAVVPAIQDMRKEVEADEKKSVDALHVNLQNHWRQIDRKLNHLNASLLKETSAMSASLEEKTNALSKSINTEVAASTVPVAQALALAVQAKSTSHEARTDAQSAAGSLDGVGFVKLAGTDCPEGSKTCTLWSWINPQLMDPYCSHGTYVEAADGKCEQAFNGELKNQLWGCCRDGQASVKENLNHV